MILNYETVDMKDKLKTEKLLEKTFSVVKNNIDNSDIKTQVYSVKLNDGRHSFPDYIKVSLNKKKYDIALQDVMDYFIENEWYEDCAEVKKYQSKLKKLQNNEQQPTGTKPAAVKAEL